MFFEFVFLHSFLMSKICHDEHAVNGFIQLAVS